MPFLARRRRVKPRAIVRNRHRKPLLAKHDPDLDALRMAAVDRVPNRLLYSHTGVKNILTDVREMLGERGVYTYVGGLHLYKLTDAVLSELADELAVSGISQILTGHCTGEHAFAFLRQRLGEQIRQISAGFSCTL